MAAPGTLYYLVGPSGSGKDSLLGQLRAGLEGSEGVLVAHRYITRPAGAGGENHVALSDGEFEVRLRRGCFALHWESHGWRYGVGIELHAWLARGLDVVVNGSRAYLPEARRRMPGLRAVLVEVSPEALRRRLQARGREGAVAIVARLRRAAEYPVANVYATLCNDGPVEEAGGRLLELITGGEMTQRCS